MRKLVQKLIQILSGVLEILPYTAVNLRRLFNEDPHLFCSLASHKIEGPYKSCQNPYDQKHGCMLPGYLQLSLQNTHQRIGDQSDEPPDHKRHKKLQELDAQHNAKYHQHYRNEKR